MFARPEAPTRAPLRRRPVALTVVLSVVLLAGGCRDKSAPETVVPAGFVAVRDASSGFAVAVPADWIQIPLPTGDLDEFDEKSRALLARYEGLGPAINSARQILQSGGKLMAVTPDGSSRINLTIDKADEKSLEEITQKTTRLLQENGATDLQQSPATTGAGPAVKMTFKYPIPARGNETVVADEVQYYLLRGKKSIVLTVINTPPDVAEAVAGSLRLR
jgi:hypothetical protein